VASQLGVRYQNQGVSHETEPPASERARYAAEIRKPGPVKRLSREEIAKLEHQRNLAMWLDDFEAPKANGWLSPDERTARRNLAQRDQRRLKKHGVTP
jgi:hypothetical protein